MVRRVLGSRSTRSLTLIAALALVACGSSSDDPGAVAAPGGGGNGGMSSGGSSSGGAGASGATPGGSGGSTSGGHGGTSSGGTGGHAGSGASGGTGGGAPGGGSGHGGAGQSGAAGKGGAVGQGGAQGGSAGSGPGGGAGGSGGAGQSLFLDGFFPIGVFVQPADSFDKWKGRGVNTVVEVPQGGDAAAWTTAATTAGMHMVRPPLGDPATDAKNPLLLAWSHPDEPDRMTDMDPASALAANYATWKSAAPSVPVFLNFSGFTIMETDVTNPAVACNGPGDGANEGCYPAYIATADFLGNDNYPVAGYNQTPDGGLVGKTIAKLSKWSGGRPQFVYIESSDQDAPWLGSADQSRGVTPDELRGEIWDAICHGVRGLFYFPVKPFMSFSFDATPDDVVAEMTKEDARITGLAPVLQSAIDPAPVAVTVAAPLETTWRTTSAGTWVVVLALSPTGVTAAPIALGGVTASKATVVGEARTVDVKNGVIVDDFGPYGVHVYQL